MILSFGERAQAAVADLGRLCVGIDPHPQILRSWGLTDSAAGARELGERVVQAAAGRVGFVKPQVALFERFGAEGLYALEQVLAASRTAGILTIADAKRGDIGSTMDAYAQAWLTPGNTLESDALTVNPYLGVGALRGAIDLAHSHGKGIFVLAATSNPEAGMVQQAQYHGVTVAARIAEEVSDLNRARVTDGQWGSIGLVIGATVDQSCYGIADPLNPAAPILAPGFGHQGAQLNALATIFNRNAPWVLASESRSILGDGAENLVTRIELRRGMLEEDVDG